MKLQRLISALLVTLGAALQAYGQAPPTARVLELTDRPVVDAAGAKLAEVYDVVVDTTEGRVAYLVVTVGLRVVPIPMPSPEISIQADRVVLAMSRARLEATPTLDMSALGANYKRGRDILGADLKDQKGIDIGDVKDLVVNTVDGMIANVVIAFDPKAWDQPGWVALPRSSVRHEGRDFVATFNLDDMRPATQAQAEQRRIDAARAAAVSVNRDERASQLVGRKIIDAQGKPVGEVTDLAIDPGSGSIPYMIVNAASGGAVALPLPVKDLRRSDSFLVLPAGAQALSAPPAGAAARRASEILAKNLVDARGKNVGKLRDLVVNLGAAKVHYAVAEFDPSWVQAGQLVTVRLPREDMKMELNALMGAMMFSQGAWPDLNNEQFLANIEGYLAKH
jgi:sporulation protein YlmC with PRC-barrel domain